MGRFEEAVQALIVAAKGPPTGYETTRERAGTVVQEAGEVERGRRNQALHSLAPVVAGAEAPHLGLVAMACGAIVEHGADPLLVVHPVLDRLRETLEPAALFIGALHDAARDAGDEDEDLDTLLERYASQVGPTRRKQGNAFGSLDLLWRPACTLIASSPEARRIYRGDADLIRGVRTLVDDHSGIAYLWELLQVLDGEDLLVIDPALQRGYEVMISGIADNFQLHTLLADALIGNPAEGWLSGTRPDPQVVVLARDVSQEDAGSEHLSAEGAFNMLNWTALLADGTLPAGMAARDHWIWGEGVPADILPFEGTRIVLLGPAPYVSTWNPGRRFPLMPAELTVRRQLSPEEVGVWLRRFATAPR
jgi:hypothetical protein